MEVVLPVDSVSSIYSQDRYSRTRSHFCRSKNYCNQLDICNRSPFCSLGHFCQCMDIFQDSRAHNLDVPYFRHIWNRWNRWTVTLDQTMQPTVLNIWTSFVRLLISTQLETNRKAISFKTIKSIFFLKIKVNFFFCYK